MAARALALRAGAHKSGREERQALSASWGRAAAASLHHGPPQAQGAPPAPPATPTSPRRRASRSSSSPMYRLMTSSFSHSCGARQAMSRRVTPMLVPL